MLSSNSPQSSVECEAAANNFRILRQLLVTSTIVSLNGNAVAPAQMSAYKIRIISNRKFQNDPTCSELEKPKQVDILRTILSMFNVSLQSWYKKAKYIMQVLWKIITHIILKTIFDPSSLNFHPRRHRILCQWHVIKFTAFSYFKKGQNVVLTVDLSVIFYCVCEMLFVLEIPILNT